MEPAVVTVIAVCFVVGLAAGWLLARFLHPRFGVVAALLAVVVMLGLIVAGRGAQGWDGLAHVIMALFMAAPVAVGAGAGTALGFWQRRRARR